MTNAVSPELQTQLAYAAGIFDGEGCIHISKAAGRYYSYCAKVAMTRREPLNLLESVFGGTIADRPVRGTRRKQWDWSVYGKEAESFLVNIYPYLRIKSYEAVLALILASSLHGTDNKGKELTVEMLNLRELIFIECRLAKRWSEVEIAI